MKFLLGVTVGALGLWAYQGGKLQRLMGSAPEPVQQAFNTAGDRVGQAVNSDQVRQVASMVQDKVQQPAASPIVRPTAAEVATRPSEPLPRSEPEGVHIQTS